METIKRKSKMGELLTIMLKTRLEKIAKKVMTAIIVFGMVISPAVNAMAMLEENVNIGDAERNANDGAAGDGGNGGAAVEGENAGVVEGNVNGGAAGGGGNGNDGNRPQGNVNGGDGQQELEMVELLEEM
ncbi:hypothetical protein AGMMS49950_07050 [Endomicrobiia bacterium]|nr:hypothetical protein AGMMS49950_07050 [Endomicrobiia bacterium]